jgi:hypothetical protein
MIAEVSDVGEENIAGGFAIMERYALLAVDIVSVKAVVKGCMPAHQL